MLLKINTTVRRGRQTEKNMANNTNRGGMGVAVGLALGILLTIIFKRLAVGLAVGLIIGLLLFTLTREKK
jgi:uncharacterized membrane protein